MNNDIVFISYGEDNAEENFTHILDMVKHGGIARVKDVKGIPEAHLAAAKKAGTDWFYVVDADAWVYDSFKFDYVPDSSPDTTHVWLAKNPYNGLEYGYGGVKMFHRRTLIDRLKTFEMGADMSTGLFENFHVVEEVISETRFATSNFTAWRGAFRECVKLQAKAIAGQIDKETSARLQTWMFDAEGEFSAAILSGAAEGSLYARRNALLDKLKKINDFDWLQKRYEDR